MFSVSKLLVVVAIAFLVAGLVIIGIAISQDSVNDLRTNTEIDLTFFLGFGCLVASYLIAPTSKRHHW